jgi:hypothetical protein
LQHILIWHPRNRVLGVWKTDEIAFEKRTKSRSINGRNRVRKTHEIAVEKRTKSPLKNARNRA